MLLPFPQTNTRSIQIFVWCILLINCNLFDIHIFRFLHMCNVATNTTTVGYICPVAVDNFSEVEFLGERVILHVCLIGYIEQEELSIIFKTETLYRQTLLDFSGGLGGRKSAS